MKLKLGALIAAALCAPLAVAAPSIAAAQTAVTGIGQRIFVANTGNVTASFVGASAGYTDRLFLEGRNDAIFNNKTSAIGSMVDLGSFTAGTELIFRLNSIYGGTNAAPQSYDFFSGPADRNPDGIAHAAANTTGNVTFVGFEDLYGGGDRDYNDLMFSFTNTSAGAVPEPATWAMMILGMGGVGFAMRRRKSKVTTTVAYA